MKLVLWKIVRAATFVLVVALALIVALNIAANELEVLVIDVVLLALSSCAYCYASHRVRALTEAHSVR